MPSPRSDETAWISLTPEFLRLLRAASTSSGVAASSLVITPITGARRAWAKREEWRVRFSGSATSRMTPAFTDVMISAW